MDRERTPRPLTYSPHEPSIWRSLGTWTGFGMFCLYAAAVAAGFILILRRDA